MVVLVQQEHIKPWYYTYNGSTPVYIDNIHMTHWIWNNFMIAPVAAFRSIKNNRVITKGRLKGYQFYRKLDE